MNSRLVYRAVVFILCILGVGGCGQKTGDLDLQTDLEQQEEIGDVEEVIEEESQEIFVYVCGAVAAPGVYCLPNGARVYEAIEAAGGMTEEADKTYVNQAEEVSDGAKLQIFTKDEVEQAGRNPDPNITGEDGLGGQSPQDQQNGKVNLNTATIEELKTLPGIGDMRAEAIIAYRKSKGPFTSIDQLKEIAGIKGKIYEKIEEYIVIK